MTKTVCSKYARMLTENLKTPEKGYLMDFIIDVNVDDPKILKNRLDEPMKVRNFKYEPLNK